MLCKIWPTQVCSLVFLICLNYIACGTGLVHVQTFNGEIGATNFTYYKLTLEGHVVISLHTFDGDADLYLSTETLKPTWEDYTMKSDTCDQDTVEVQHFHGRPVGIGVYGYINYPVSKFQLSVYIDESKQSHFPEERKVKNPESHQHTYDTNDPMQSDAQFPAEEEESLLWNIFVGFLKVLFDILI